ncbi:MAG: hypothetical protein NWR36_10320, partial [Opitutales bacterium]|nr:hypothetical protein [Opitutales bacterium]
VNLKSRSGVPTASLKVDASRPILSVDFYYTRQGQVDGLKDDSNNTKNRFWHHAEAKQQGENWLAKLPLFGVDQPLWVYANVRYALDAPVSYAGYYYGVGTTESFNLSSLMFMTTADELKAAGVRSTLVSSLMIEDFEDDWEKEWFSYRPNEWARSTHKIYDARWKAPEGAKLNLQVSAAEANKLVIRLDDYAAEVILEGGSGWEAIELTAKDFTNGNSEPLESFEGIKELELSPKESVKGSGDVRRTIGANWNGADPAFKNLSWSL